MSARLKRVDCGSGRSRRSSRRAARSLLSTTTITTHEVLPMTRQADTSSVYRPVPPPPTRRDLRRAAAVQAAWLADLR